MGRPSCVSATLKRRGRVRATALSYSAVAGDHGPMREGPFHRREQLSGLLEEYDHQAVGQFYASGAWFRVCTPCNPLLCSRRGG